MSIDKTENHIRYGFRFNGIDKSLADEFASMNEDLRVIVKKRFDNNVYVASLWFTDSRPFDRIKHFIEHNKISDENYGFFVSLTTEYDSDIISVPDFLIDFIKEVGGKLDFSFTCV